MHRNRRPGDAYLIIGFSFIKRNISFSLSVIKVVLHNFDKHLFRIYHQLFIS